MLDVGADRMFGAMAERVSARARVEEGLREIGVLLMALSPLDTGLANDRNVPWLRLLSFLSVGLIFFGAAVFSERRSRG